jgi:hypothetical protein
LPYSPGSLPTDKQARRAAREFADLISRDVNATVSECPVSFLELAEGSELGIVAHYDGRIPAPMQMKNGRYLFLYQLLGLRHPERYLTTIEYRYVYQETPDPDSWIFRYEYQREPLEDYPYPKAHLHLNADPTSYPGTKAFPKLHIPTGRVTVEAVLRHLLDEHGVPCISPHWQSVLSEGEKAYAGIQRLRTDSYT